MMKKLSGQDFTRIFMAPDETAYMNEANDTIGLFPLEFRIDEPC